jgi:hypothetical protein
MTRAGERRVGRQPQLYDLSGDPGETRDLAAAEPETAARLTKAVVAWNRSMPADKGPALGKKAVNAKR